MTSFVRTGVSGAILNAAGQAVVDECNSLGTQLQIYHHISVFYWLNCYSFQFSFKMRSICISSDMFLQMWAFGFAIVPSLI